MLKFPINTHNILQVHSTQTGVHSISFARIRIRLIMSHSLATVMLWHFLKLSSRIAEAAVQTQIDSIAVAIVSCKCLAYKVYSYKQRDMQHYAAVAAAFCLCTLIESTPMRALHHRRRHNDEFWSAELPPPQFVANWLEISIRIFLDNWWL